MPAPSRFGEREMPSQAKKSTQPISVFFTWTVNPTAAGFFVWTAAGFGVINSTVQGGAASPERLIQFALKFIF